MTPNNIVKFVRFYNANDTLEEITMSDIEELIRDEKNKELIAKYIYERYYNRYLKIFTFAHSEEKTYYKNEIETKRNIFKEEYKNGFVIMASCFLLIETLASFLNGNDKTPHGGGDDAFEEVFKKAVEYNNELKVFSEKKIYKYIRNGLLHQGETYGKFKILRTGELYDEVNKSINATKFYKHLDELLIGYRDELSDEKFDDELWDNCRIKLRHIINNS